MNIENKDKLKEDRLLLNGLELEIEWSINKWIIISKDKTKPKMKWKE